VHFVTVIGFFNPSSARLPTSSFRKNKFLLSRLKSASRRSARATSKGANRRTVSPSSTPRSPRANTPTELDHDYKGIKVLDVQYIGADASKSASITASTLAANPDLAAIYTTMDAGAEGAANALRAAGKQVKVRVIGFDATLHHQVELLKAGDDFASA
jgi:hypothetical protein